MWPAVALLLVVYVGLAWQAVRAKGATFDEAEQLVTGYNIWLRDDYRMESANGDFVKRWATLPLLISRPNMVSASDPAWRSGDAYWTGSKFFFESGNDPDRLLRQGRAMILLIGVATALLVFWCARELFGDAGGVLALGVFVFSPNMLAFGAIVSTEMTLCLALLGSTWCVWRLLHRVTWGRIARSLGIFVLLVLSKPTAVLILPTVALMLVARMVVGRPLEICLGARPERRLTARWTQTKWFFAFIALHALVGWTAIWAHYGFHYFASPNPADPGIATMARTHRDPISPVMLRAIDAARNHRLFPEG